MEPKKCEHDFQVLRPQPKVACVKCGEIPKEKLLTYGYFFKNLK